VVLSADDRLLVLTDGFTEAQDAAGKLYGEDRVAEFMAGLADDARRPLHTLFEQVSAFEAGHPASDDMAALLLSLGASVPQPAPLPDKAFQATVLAETAAISALTDQIIDYLGAAGVDARTTHHVALGTEEILTNLGTHGGSSDSPATVRISVGPEDVTAEIVDTGVEFDLRTAPEPDLRGDIAERAVGGLGLHLIREFASRLDYSRRDGTNCTIFAIARARLT
jgi:anti-sigma regulatory factor (Ser/Thr protein kinase)